MNRRLLHIARLMSIPLLPLLTGLFQYTQPALVASAWTSTGRQIRLLRGGQNVSKKHSNELRPPIHCVIRGGCVHLGTGDPISPCAGPSATAAAARFSGSSRRVEGCTWLPGRGDSKNGQRQECNLCLVRGQEGRLELVLQRYASTRHEDASGGPKARPAAPGRARRHRTDSGDRVGHHV